MHTSYSLIQDSSKLVASAVNFMSTDHVLLESLDQATALLISSPRVVISGLGKSEFIARKIAATLTSVGLPTIYMDPVSAFHGDLGNLGGDDCLILISNSGTTKEILDLLSHAQRVSPLRPVISITCDTGSVLQKKTLALTYPKVEEFPPLGRAPTTTSLCQLFIGDLISSLVSNRTALTDEGFARFHPQGDLGIKTALVSKLMTEISHINIVPGSTSVKQALLEMSSHGMCIVTEEGFPDSVSTYGDVCRFLSTSPGCDLETQTIESISKHHKPITVPLTATGADCQTLIRSSGVGFLVVVDGGSTVGLVYRNQLGF